MIGIAMSDGQRSADGQKWWGTDETIKVLLLTGNRGGKILEPLLAQGVACLYYPVGRDLKTIIRLICETMIRRPKCGSVIVDSAAWRGVAAYIVAVRWGLPLIFRLRGDVIRELEEQRRRLHVYFFHRHLKPKIRVLIPVSGFLKSVYVNLHNFIDGETVVINTPQHEFQYSEDDYDSRKNEILMVMNFKYRDKALTLAHYWNDLSTFFRENKEFRMRIVGDGYYLDNVRKSIPRDLVQKISFEGYREDVPSFYERSFCLLYLSTLDGYPSVVNEARILGLPVICNKDVGMVDQIEDLHDGIFVGPSVGRTVGQAMEMLKCRDFWKAISTNGRERVLANNSVRVIGEHFVSVLRNVNKVVASTEKNKTHRGSSASRVVKGKVL
jgi:glycosyltransferase involved in cell wall biosynthesis